MKSSRNQGKLTGTGRAQRQLARMRREVMASPLAQSLLKPSQYREAAWQLLSLYRIASINAGDAPDHYHLIAPAQPNEIKHINRARPGVWYVRENNVSMCRVIMKKPISCEMYSLKLRGGRHWRDIAARLNIAS